MKPFIPLIFLLISSSLFAVEPDRVAILLHEKTQNALDEPPRTYITDVEQRFPAKLGIVAGVWQTPVQLRERLGDAAVKNIGY